jgi:inosine-uridine nucleoside N-ribohydrolase
MKCPTSILVVILGVMSGTNLLAAGRHKVILDTDGNADYDDFVNIMLVSVSPEIDLLGIVVTGSDAVGRTRTVAKLLHLMGRDDVGMYFGEDSHSPKPAFAYNQQFPRRDFGMTPELDGWARNFQFKPETKSGVDFYLEAVAKSPGEVTVVVDGPLSTLATAFGRAGKINSTQGFPRSIRQILFSGGDFGTVEWNVYCDLDAARSVFHSGAVIYQFGGEDETKPYLTYADRQQLWKAQTPATWALQDYYRLYRAGWDSRSPFVPILYDVSPVEFLIEGEKASKVVPAALDFDSLGHLIRVQGSPNGYSRIDNHGDVLVRFVIERLTSHVQPVVNHLRAILGLPAPMPQEVRATVEAILNRILDGNAGSQLELQSLFDSLEPRLARLGPEAENAQWHVEMARKFLFGESRKNTWQDPYKPKYVWAAVRLDMLYTLVTSNKRKIALGLFLLSCLVAVGWAAKRWRPFSPPPVQ